jgi:hypothetical protein
VSLEASTKLHVHKKIHELLINVAFIIACPNFKKGMKMAFVPLGVRVPHGSHKVPPKKNSNVIIKVLSCLA